MVEWPTQIGLLWPARVYDAVVPTALVAGPSNQQMFAQLTRWLEGGAKNPVEAVQKKRLKQLLAS